jgi:hypothetical protein
VFLEESAGRLYFLNIFFFFFGCTVVTFQKIVACPEAVSVVAAIVGIPAQDVP